MWVALVILFALVGAFIVRNIIWTYRQGADRRHAIRAARRARNHLPPRPR